MYERKELEKKTLPAGKKHPDTYFDFQSGIRFGYFGTDFITIPAEIKICDP